MAVLPMSFPRRACPHEGGDGNPQFRILSELSFYYFDGGLWVNDEHLIAGIGDASRQRLDQPDPIIDFAKQEHVGVTGDRSAIEVGLDFFRQK
jgi:hypothetical protein